MKDKYKSKGQLISDIEGLRRRVEELESMCNEQFWPEKARQESESRYQSLLETNLYGIQEIDIYGIITYMNTIQYNILGYESGALRGRQIWDILASDADRDSLTDYLTKVAENEKIPFNWVGKYLREDGSTVELQVNWNPLRTNNGQVTGFVSMISDILDHEKASVEPDETEPEPVIEPEVEPEVDTHAEVISRMDTIEAILESLQEGFLKTIEPEVEPEPEVDTHTEMISRMDTIEATLESLQEGFLKTIENDAHQETVLDSLHQMLSENKTWEDTLLESMSKMGAVSTSGSGADPEDIDAVRQSIDVLSQVFEEKIKNDAHKNRVIDQLHKDLQDYKNDFLKKYLKSMIMDVIQIIDNIRKLTVHYNDMDPAEADPGKLLDIIDSIPSDLEDLFFRHGVKPFTCKGAAFDPRRQRVLKTIATDDMEKDKTVAESLRPGYEWDGEVIRPEMITANIHKPAPKQSKNSNGNKQ